MRRFYINQLIEFISAIRNVSGESDPQVSVLRTSVTTTPVHGFVPSFETLLKLAEGLELAAVADERAVLSDFGCEIVSETLGQNSILSDKGRHALALRFFKAKGELSALIMRLLRNFRFDGQSGSRFLDVKDIHESEFGIVCALVDLAVISECEGGYFLKQRYNVPFEKTFAERGGAVSAAQLEKKLEEQRRIGEAAERIALRHERARLRKAGRHFEAGAVRRLSEIDVGAGYDIESFDGTSPSAEFDRFIEVKGSRDESLRFFISKNELETAKRLADKYWLYFVSNVGSRGNSRIRKIQNLSEYLSRHVLVSTYPVLWRVTESES